MTELDRWVVDGADDTARFKNADYWNKDHARLRCGYPSVTHKGGGGAARFLNVTIPQGSTIDAAYLTLTGDDSPGTETVVNTRLRAQAADNAATFSTQTDFDARSWTSAYVNWDNIAPWETDKEYNSEELKTIIQEVINRAGWASGNALVILWDDWEERSTAVPGCFRSSYSHDGSTTKCAKLHIEYTPPPVVGRSWGQIIG